MAEPSLSASEIRLTHQRLGEVRQLTSIRLIRCFSLLRRSGVLAQRRRFGLSEVEWKIMVQLGEFAPLSLNGLAERLLQDRGQVSRTVKSMVQRGLLTRKRKPGGPEIEIDLTPEGEQLHAQLVDYVFDRDERMIADISDEDIRTFRRIVDVMIERAEVMLDEEQELRS